MCICLWIFLQPLSHYKSIAMEKQNILTADVLDILFDGRNKDYGAYDLRKTYNRRMYKALASVFLFAGLCYGGYVLANNAKGKNNGVMIGGDVILIDPPPPTEPPPLVEPVKPKAPEVKTVVLVTPKIAPDDLVPDEAPIPNMDDIDKAKIGSVKSDGDDFDGEVGPANNGNEKGIVATPQKLDDDDNGFVPVEIEAEYPGGINAWRRYLTSSLEKNYPQDAIDNNVQGTVYVQFIVDAEGTVSNVEAVSGPEELKPAAVAVIKKSGKWTPAFQNKRHVKSYKKQPIIFKLEE